MPEHVGFIARVFGESVSRAPHGFWDVGILGLIEVMLAMKAYLIASILLQNPVCLFFVNPKHEPSV